MTRWLATYAPHIVAALATATVVAAGCLTARAVGATINVLKRRER